MNLGSTTTQATASVIAAAIAGALLAASGAAAVQCPVGSSPTASGNQCSEAFGYTGSPQVFTVPAGVTSLLVVADGAQGGADANEVASGNAPGWGGQQSENLLVTPGEQLTLIVGGAGQDGDAMGVYGAGGYGGGGIGADGGGGGGGGTFVYSSSGILELAAGGGGGAGGDAGDGDVGGDGGNGGGKQGAGDGGDGSSPVEPQEAGTGGKAGAAGGGGAAGGSGSECPFGGWSGTVGTAATAGGGPASGPTSPGPGGTGEIQSAGPPASCDAAGGGGGGGGYYGGGGGGGGYEAGGGGGGGSGFAAASTSASSSGVADTNEGLATVTFTPAGGTGTTGGTGATARIALAGKPKAGAGGVTLKLHCSAPTGHSCKIKATLSTGGTLRNGRRMAVGAAQNRTARRRQILASKSATIAAGTTGVVKLSLDHAGRKLLEHSHKLTVTLTVTLSGQSTAAVTRTLTIK